jgi:xylose isomerase
VHPIELFEFFYTLRKNEWEGVWQLDQFPFREDSIQAADLAIDFLKRCEAGLDRLDWAAMAKAQAAHDALTAQRLAQEALYG